MGGLILGSKLGWYGGVREPDGMDGSGSKGKDLGSNDVTPQFKLKEELGTTLRGNRGTSAGGQLMARVGCAFSEVWGGKGIVGNRFTTQGLIGIGGFGVHVGSDKVGITEAIGAHRTP